MALTPLDLSIRFFLQLVVILAACQATGWVFRRIGQSQVVSEMIAGVLLGPSLLGWLFPSAAAYLFPKASMPILFAVAQLGLVLYMFLVGLEFDLALIRARARGAALVSAAGIAAPFALGGLIAWWLHGDAAWALFGERVTSLQAVLFMGAAMSITAFPMLARDRPRAGALADAARDARPRRGLARRRGGVVPPRDRPLGFRGRPVARDPRDRRRRLVPPRDARARKALPRAPRREARAGREMSTGLFVRVLVLLMLGAFVTDALRIYAVFGAFLTGAAMPKGRFAEEITKRIEPLTVGLLLPLFFVYSGLNTTIGLVATPALAGLGLVILAAACFGKGVACWGAARLAGAGPRDALATGALMNARGLMELIILNIGLERGIIRPTLFTLMVLMAVVTTLAATPLFERVYGRRAARLGGAASAG